MTREVVQIIDKETGDVNNLRDKKLADSTTQQQSGSASTDSVVMKTTGGDYVEIARDSFVGAIKSVMDGLIKGNSYTTLGANDPIAAFNSNALGGITPANLASVLGGLTYFRSIKYGYLTVNTAFWKYTGSWRVYFECHYTFHGKGYNLSFIVFDGSLLNVHFNTHDGNIEVTSNSRIMIYAFSDCFYIACYYNDIGVFSMTDLNARNTPNAGTECTISRETVLPSGGTLIFDSYNYNGMPSF